MCGIVGQVRWDGGAVAAPLLEAMCAALEHRGPDSRGLHAGDGVGLGIQRLRVIDLATGDQPIANEDGTVVVVFNGEIYNFRELRARLAARGHRFATASDTEVIVHLYEEEGVDCVRALHGMFAIALWDGARRQLMLARDRVGKKPLFYAERGGALSFASELNALMADPEIPRALDHAALDAYFAYGHVPSPMSAFAAVRKLPPASVLVHRDGRSSIRRYWTLDYGHKRAVSDPRDVREEIRAAIRRAVRRRLVADVPLGAFLSGGIDSSTVVWAMAEASPAPVKTFSIGFESDVFDELPHARAVAERFATEHHELVVRPDAMALMPKVVRHYGEPFADPSALPSFYLAELTRREVTVALNGDGGDESFGGYPRYTSNLLLERLARLPVPVRRALAAAADRLPDSGTIDSTMSRMRRLSRSVELDAPGRYVAYSTGFGAYRDLFTQDYRAAIGDSAVPEVILAPWRDSTARHLVDRMLDVDVQTYLPDHLLVKIDIATMAYSLEARSPLLDHEFLELAASLPARMKVRGLEKKVGLRDAMRGILPDEILDRPKRGFQLPLVEWFRSDLRGYAADVLLDPGALARGYFARDQVEGLLERHATGREDRAETIWALLMFELWHRELVDGAGRRAPGSAPVPIPAPG
jgi:asparagine synthase (glutamine-hydrolysing)